MRLADLDPKLEGTVERGVLRFDCPLGDACPLGGRIRIHIHAALFAVIGDTKHWQATGSFPDSLTLQPSINEYTVHIDPTTGKPLVPEQIAVQGWHGLITNGAVT